MSSSNSNNNNNGGGNGNGSGNGNGDGRSSQTASTSPAVSQSDGGDGGRGRGRGGRRWVGGAYRGALGGSRGGFRFPGAYPSGPLVPYVSQSFAAAQGTVGGYGQGNMSGLAASDPRSRWLHADGERAAAIAAVQDADLPALAAQARLSVTVTRPNVRVLHEMRALADTSPETINAAVNGWVNRVGPAPLLDLPALTFGQAPQAGAATAAWGQPVVQSAGVFGQQTVQSFGLQQSQQHQQHEPEPEQAQGGMLGELAQMVSGTIQRTRRTQRHHETTPASGSGVLASTRPVEAGHAPRQGSQQYTGVTKNTVSAPFTRTARRRRGCGNCGRADHTVAVCAHPWADGFVHGCPVCSASDHHTPAGCQWDWPTRLARKFTMAVVERANRPPLLAFKDWPGFVRLAAERGIQLRTSPPWTQFMALTLIAAAEGNPASDMPWARFNYVENNPAALPVDQMSVAYAWSAAGLDVLSWMLREAPVMTAGGPWEGSAPLPLMPPMPVDEGITGDAGDDAPAAAPSE